MEYLLIVIIIVIAIAIVLYKIKSNKTNYKVSSEINMVPEIQEVNIVENKQVNELIKVEMLNMEDMLEYENDLLEVKNSNILEGLLSQHRLGKKLEYQE